MNKNFKGVETESYISKILSDMDEQNYIDDFENNITENTQKNKNYSTNSNIFEGIGKILLEGLSLLANLYIMIFVEILKDGEKNPKELKNITITIEKIRAGINKSQ